MNARFKNCQSCGMPLKRDEKGGGSNQDGTLSFIYCSHCFQAGQFTRPDITLSEMKTLVQSKLKEFGIPFFLIPFFTRNMKNLVRWKRDS